MPDVELKKLKDNSIEELAVHFGVPQEKVKLRLTLFNADK